MLVGESGQTTVESWLSVKGLRAPAQARDLERVPDAEGGDLVREPRRLCIKMLI
jgi:hypothetical protein